MAEVLSAVYVLDYRDGGPVLPPEWDPGRTDGCGWSVGEEVPLAGRTACLVRVWAEAAPMAALRAWAGALWLCDIEEEEADA